MGIINRFRLGATPHLTRRRGAHPRQRLWGKNRIFDGDMISLVTAFVDLGPQGDQLGEPQ